MTGAYTVYSSQIIIHCVQCQQLIKCTNFMTQTQHSWSCTLHIDVRDEDYQTPLHHACRRGHIEVVDYLVKQGKCAVGKFSKYFRPKVGAALPFLSAQVNL